MENQLDDNPIELFYLQIFAFLMLNAKSFSHRELLNILKNHDFLLQNIRADRLSKFGDMIAKISLVLGYHAKSEKQKESFGSRLRSVFEIIDEFGKKDSLGKTFKKLAVIHTFARNAALNDSFDEQFANVCCEQLQGLKREDFKRLTKDKTWGFDRISDLVKEFGKSGAQSIEQQPWKGVIKEIIEKIYYPFCHYLLKITQDRQLYTVILQGKATQDQIILWKMINLSKLLGNIAKELNRICRYFRSELLGVYSHLAYIISLDICLYYNTLRTTISQQCSRWRAAIQLMEDKRTEDHRKFQRMKEDILKDDKFNELRREIEQLSAIREDLIWIYLNRELKPCLKFFSRPINGIQIEINPTTNHITFVQTFMEHTTQQVKNGRRERRASIEMSDDPHLLGKEFDIANVSTGLSISSGLFDAEQQP